MTALKDRTTENVRNIEGKRISTQQIGFACFRLGKKQGIIG